MTKLIIPTFLIAIFLLGYWIYDIWPRYELQKHIIVNEQYMDSEYINRISNAGIEDLSIKFNKETEDKFNTEWTWIGVNYPYIDINSNLK